MKKLLVIAVLAITASSTLFAQTVSFNTKPNRFGEFMNGFMGRSKDIQDCRTVIQGDVSPLEAAALAAATRSNTNDFGAIVTAVTQAK